MLGRVLTTIQKLVRSQSMRGVGHVESEDIKVHFIAVSLVIVNNTD